MSAAVLVALAGCGGPSGEAPSEAYEVAIERAAFPRSQRLGVSVTFVITVRNAGERTIPNLAVTLRGFDDGADRDRWLVDEPPPGTSATDDTWTAGPLRAAATTTLRWKVTPVAAGTHELSYLVGAGVLRDSRTTSRGGGRPGGRVTVRVRQRPADARVDPRSGRVLRE